MAAVLDSVRAFFAPTAFTIDAENPSDVVARENLLDRAMGPNRRKKSSETIRRDRVPAEGLALVARDPRRSCHRHRAPLEHRSRRQPRRHADRCAAARPARRRFRLRGQGHRLRR